MRTILFALYLLYTLCLIAAPPVLSSCAGGIPNVRDALDRADKAIVVARSIADFLLGAVPDDATRGEAKSISDDLIDAATHLRNTVEAAGPATKEALAAFARFRSAYDKAQTFGAPYKLAQAAQGMPPGLMGARGDGGMLVPHIDDLDPNGGG